ncbi:RnfABCDGE type electron transport complex subunit B [Fastidiosibacter lacustris]|uniref:RnfABCDGE type electron transport complex subunit B n=1 Tax=Fastidiosibacter lacustris TaxID=2056695 RepID=UPI000E3522CF|nr:RnfABCDGE type electron transport complex subunit B [Fastidiosibacter lacustris]
MIISIDDIDALLPQTQCTKCGYKDCYNYAQAITNGEKHNRCPPGGQEGADRLAKLLQREKLPLDTSCGIHQPKKVAIINEDLCIGCTKCILACPVDAIVGAKKLMHTVLSNECTGCDLCVVPCPMDCIEMQILPDELQPERLNLTQKEAQKNYYRLRHNERTKRLETKQKKETKNHKQNIVLSKLNIDKKAYIQQALTEFKNRKNLN